MVLFISLTVKHDVYNIMFNLDFALMRRCLYIQQCGLSQPRCHSRTTRACVVATPTAAGASRASGRCARSRARTAAPCCCWWSASCRCSASRTSPPTCSATVSTPVRNSSSRPLIIIKSDQGKFIG